MTDDARKKAEHGKLIATVFHHCALKLHNKGGADVAGTMSAAKSGGVTMDMLREYGRAHSFSTELLSVMEQAFAA